ncbi:unnamed protein product [Somion occarium]|uniref:Golgi apparatus membrane protein TVP38 n=1 Tax=Somion occarium TaxID=3059160 RepID=A0ABP1E7H1_9APHY
MTSSYQAYGANIPTLPYSNAAPNNSAGYPPHHQHTTGYSERPEPKGWRRDAPPLKREDSVSSKDGDTVVLMREVSRTPSPTPSEVVELNKTSLFDFKAMLSWRYWIRKEWRWYYLIGTIALVFVILFTVYHKQIVNWLHPAAKWMHDLPAGWLIPIAIFFVISFPPLFGHEILAILCGLVWGLGPGFGIVAAGTFIGELGNFYAFKYCCSVRGEKYERTKLSYAYLARVVRDGGFRIALIARFSAIPGHFTTAVFSTCGMDVWTFSLAAILSLPKQFLTVYLGVALEQSETGETSKTDTIIKTVVIVITTIVTIGAMWYVYRKMEQVKPKVIYERRKARQAKLVAAGGSTPYLNAPSLEANDDSGIFNPNGSNTNIPLNRSSPPEHQQWDAEGRAVGFAADPTLYAPQPKRPTRLTTSQPGSRSGTPPSAASGPAMRERDRPYRHAPLRQDTASSDASWDATQDSSSLAKIPPPPATRRPSQSTVSHQLPYPLQSGYHPNSAPPPYIPSPTTSTQQSYIPPSAPFAAPSPGNISQQSTPTQANFSPSHIPLPFSQPQGHIPEASESSFYTAQGGHSRTGTEDQYHTCWTFILYARTASVIRCFSFLLEYASRKLGFV